MDQDSSNQNTGDRHRNVQRIARLTPLGAVLALVEAQIEAVKPQTRALATALGYTLAEDGIALERPDRPIALRDGFAVASAAVADAGPYLPMALPYACRVGVGEALPNGADAVLPHDAVTLRNDRVEAVAPITAGEGVLPAGGDAASGMALRRSGQRLRGIDIAVLSAAGVTEVSLRVPRIRIVNGGVPTTPSIRAALECLGFAVTRAGAALVGSSDDSLPLDRALTEPECDAVIAVGGTGSGTNDRAVETLARVGRIAAHGIAISPGETAAFGFAAARPVLLVSGRLDAALAAWLLIGREIIAKLSGGVVEGSTLLLPLRRKVTSTIGMAELVPVRCADGMAEPLASGYLSLTALAHSDGWIVVPADSEGFPAGAQVAVRPWP